MTGARVARLFLRRVGVTLTAGLVSGVLLTILVHQLIGIVAPSWWEDGQYGFVFFVVIPCSIVVGILGSIFWFPAKNERIAEHLGFLVGVLMSLVLSVITLLLIVCVEC
ncbi:MAG TPA: hypothetical protein VGZ22_27655 [Isosphaeraceae bacterium]|nr:hypothetical protein [Isosphaeraceae bacterium]